MYNIFIECVDSVSTNIMNICKTLLIVSGDTELNPGPSKTSPKCEKSVPNRLNVHVDIHVHVLLESKNTMIQR